jgi:glycosyltransferase involved in cell wall biosynthesis
MTSPRVTVLVPVYNGAAYLDEAVRSVLDQTFTDFELLIIDDGSTDRSVEIIRGFADPRIRLERNERNLGLIATLNKGLGLAAGDYVARMDCDDVSLPNRLARQVDFMDRHPEVGMAGSWFERLENGGSKRVETPVGDGDIRYFLIFDNTFLHSSMIFRREFLEHHRLRYDPGFVHAEDYEFWVRCGAYTRLANIPEVLVRYRFHPGNISSQFRAEQGATADRVRIRHLESLGIRPGRDERELHNAFTKFEFQGDMAGLVRARAWLEKLVALGCRECGVPETAVHRHLAPYWYGACGKSADLGWEVWRLFLSSPVGAGAQREWWWKLWLRCLLRRPIVEAPNP